MGTTTLRDYRQARYACYTRAGDALFEVADALLTAAQPQAFIELSQAPGFRRGWPSLYAAFRDGQVDRAARRRLFARHAPAPAPGERLVLALDTSPIHRPEAATCADRTLVYAPNLPAGVAPTRPGWAFSTLVVLPAPVSSWTYALDNQRVASTETATAVGAAQLAAVLPLLPGRPLVTADGHYGTAKWVAATAGLPCEQLLRAKRTAVLYRPAPPPTGKPGAPRKDGPRFQGSDPATRRAPDAQWAGTDARGQAVSVARWGGLHLKARRAEAITAIRIVRAGAAGTKRDPREAWLWWLGGPLPPLATLPPLYARRFGIEHGSSSTSRRCCGRPPACGRPRRWSAGPIWWRRCIISSSWRARWRPSPTAPGSRPPARSRRSKSAGRWRGLSPSSGRRRARLDPRGKSPGRAPGTVLPPPRDSRSSARRARGGARGGARPPDAARPPPPRAHPRSAGATTTAPHTRLSRVSLNITQDETAA